MPLLSKTKVSQYKGGTAGGYLNPSKIPVGKSVRFALMPDALCEYFEVWGETNEGKRIPVRFTEEPTNADIDVAMKRVGATLATNKITGDLDTPTYVLAWAVYEYDSGEIKILPMSQPSIRDQLEDYDGKPDYEPLTDWDLELGKKVENNFTKYHLMVLPRRRPEQASIDMAWNEALDAGFDITRMVDGKDPFKAS